MGAEAAAENSAGTKLSRRRWRLLAIGLPLLLSGFASNHLEYHYRQKRLKAAADAGSMVVRTENSVAGHSQIGIDEASLDKGPERPFLRFAMLGEWAFDPQKPPPCPEVIQSLNGRESSCVGFMYPLEAGTMLRLFCLLRTTQTCCYGPRPQYNQYLFVESKQPVKFERFAPVTVSGKFFVDPQPEQGYIYRMEADAVASAAEDEPEASASEIARMSKVPLFDFAALTAMEERKPAAVIPNALLDMDSKNVTLAGFVLDRRESAPPRLVLGKYWWDGKAQGVPPTIYNAVTVFLRDSRSIPPVWKQKGIFIGTLVIVRDPALWAHEGIVIVRDAVRADGGKTQTRDAGPFIPVYAETVMFGIFTAMVLGVGRRYTSC